MSVRQKRMQARREKNPHLSEEQLRKEARRERRESRKKKRPSRARTMRRDQRPFDRQ